MALVVQGKAGPALLDSYQIERKDHAKAMIDLSVMAGHVLAPPKKWQGFVRDGICLCPELHQADQTIPAGNAFQADAEIS